MVKVHTMLSIEDDVVRKAKERDINMSSIAENALRNYTDLSEEQCFKARTAPTCSFCAMQEEWATKENLEGMTWLCPDEMWICSKCLKKEIEKNKKIY